jgi:hypothetical protein
LLQLPTYSSTRVSGCGYLKNSTEWSYKTRRADEVPTGVNRYMKMPSYLESRAKAYGCLEELEIDPRAARACSSGWNITGIASMPQKGITIKIKPEVSLGQAAGYPSRWVPRDS